MSLTVFLIIFGIIHLILCLIIYLCIRFRVLGFSEQLMPIICFVPIFGVLCAVGSEIISRMHKTGSRTTTLEELHLGDTDIRLKRLTPDEDEGMVIPLEEAMSINDAGTKRQLMLDILRRSPDQFTALLQEACLDADIEVSHYASTAVMEIQREYEYDLQRAEKRYRQEKDNPIYRDQCIDSLKKYIDSGLIDENILFVYRHRLSEVLAEKMQDEPENMDAVLTAADNYLALNNMTEAEALAKSAVSKWPSREETWLAMLNIYDRMNNGEGIKEVISRIKANNVYLSNHGRSVLAFWDGDAQTEAS